MSLSLLHVTVDCHDAAALASFWSAALGRPVDEGAGPSFASIGYPPGSGSPSWLFIQVPEGKTAKNRMHVDLSTDGDRAAEVARLVALGATHVGDHEEWGHTWSTLRDPEGNEFCVA